MRGKIVCGNWKMNTTKGRALKLALSIDKKILKRSKVQVIVCPPFPYLDPIKNTTSKVRLGAQNCYFEGSGAFTGEVSPYMLKDYVSYVILGHSERRKFLKEKDNEISLKIKAALGTGLTPIVCVGEDKNERKNNKQNQVIQKQVKSALKGLSIEEAAKIIFVYEPVWAISTFGTGEICNVSLALPAIRLIREIIKKQFEKSISENTQVLYGGSVNSLNVKEFAKEPEIDGVLVGAKSLDANDFIKIIKNF